jgi:uncharacterized protein (DUF305 family)
MKEWAQGLALMPGVLTEEQLGQQGAARGADFDTLLPKSMISHHEGALVTRDRFLAADGE